MPVARLLGTKRQAQFSLRARAHEFAGVTLHQVAGDNMTRSYVHAR
jgi:hypothetical protein